MFNIDINFINYLIDSEANLSIPSVENVFDPLDRCYSVHVTWFDPGTFEINNYEQNSNALFYFLNV